MLLARKFVGHFFTLLLLLEISSRKSKSPAGRVNLQQEE
jgi:hypothetical protein